MVVEGIGKAINHRADLDRIVSGRRCGSGILLEPQQARLEDLMLLDVTFHQALLAGQLLQLRKDHLFLDIVVVVHEATPKGDELEEILLILGLVYVGCLEINAVKPSDQRVVHVAHLVGRVYSAMRFLFRARVVSI
jgi:hypothetical protein